MKEFYEQLIESLNKEYIDNYSRPSINDIWIIITKLISYRSTCAKRRPGALIIKDSRIISIGYNGSPAGGLNCIEHREKAEEICGKDSSGGCYSAIHAEVNALAYCTKAGINIGGAKMYCTQSACINCAKLIVASGIKKFFFLEEAKSHMEGLLYLGKHNVETYKAKFNDE